MEEMKHIIQHDTTLPLKSLILDIETDGLSHQHQVLLIGMVLVEPEQISVFQYFNEDHHSEHQILLSLRAFLQFHQPHAIVTFNGTSFDLPFLNARFLHHQIPFKLPKCLSVDLMRISKKLNLESNRLKSVEEALGIHRTDTISGYESICLYQKYLKLFLTPEKSERSLAEQETCKHKILLHNYDDIVNLLDVAQIIESEDLPLMVGNYVAQDIHLHSDFLSAKLFDVFQQTQEISYIKEGSFFEYNHGKICVRIPLVSSNLGIPLASAPVVFGKPFEALNPYEKEMLVMQGIPNISRTIHTYVSRMFSMAQNQNLF